MRSGHFYRSVVAGLYWNYPVCCVLRFSWDVAVVDRSPGKMRGSIRRGVLSEFVPCGVFHHELPEKSIKRAKAEALAERYDREYLDDLAVQKLETALYGVGGEPW